MIKISVIVPVFNTGKYLERCLKSLINQNLIDIEIIVVNDCSSDNSLEILKKFQKIDKRIVLIDKKENEGLSVARNTGIELARGEYILHIDSDDWIEGDNYFKEMYETAKNNNADVVISDFYIDFNNEKVIYIQDQQQECSKEKYIEKIFLGESYPSVWNKLIKTSLYKKNNIWHPKNISLGEDLAVVPRILYYADKISVLNKAYLHYIKNPLSITNKYENKKVYEIYEVIKINEKFFHKTTIKNINILKINHLLNWLFKTRYDLGNEIYVNILLEFLKSIKHEKLRNINFSKKIIVIYILKIFNNKYMFLFLWYLYNNFNINILK